MLSSDRWFYPDLVAQGCNPRIMLDYSGNLLWGFQQMGREDILNHLKKITCDPHYQPYVEWLGTMWSHAVVLLLPSPISNYRFKHGNIILLVFLDRRSPTGKGFSPPEMHLPNHPDVLYEYIKALKECGYRWLMVQEHSVERLDGSSLQHDDKYLPNRLIARNSQARRLALRL